MARVVIATVLATAGGCSAPQEAREDEARPSPAGGGEAAPEPGGGAAPALDPRAMLRSATFGRLVEAVRALDEASAGDSTEGCLLRPPVGASGYRLAADLALAVRPLPDPPADLDAVLGAEGGAVRPITPWGQVGDAEEGPIVASLTALPPARGARGLVVFVTDRGVFLRGAGRPAPGAGAVPAGSLRGTLDRVADADDVVLVAAEAGVALSALAEVLAAVPADLAVGLGVSLPPETALPPGVGPAEDAGGAEGLCSEEDEGAGGGAGAGQLPTDAVVRGLAPLRDAGQRCLAASGSAGGALAVRFRIGPRGTVASACARSDETGSARLRACILEALRALTFPPPDPAGVVEVELPLVLRVGRQSALCEGEP